MEKTKGFQIRISQVLDENGNIDGKLDLEDSVLKSMYEFMILSRTVDNTMLKLQREGRIGTFAQTLGHEATLVGTAMALEKKDWLFPYFRDGGAQILRGMPIGQLISYWKGDERGMKIPENVNNFTAAIPVASQITHAAGAAYAAKLKKRDYAVLVYFGDGATSEGNFHEGMNFAGANRLPIVFICINNQFAISVPLKKQTASETLAQKAIAYGFEGIQVDGNDVIGVYKATKEALAKARSGKGPTLIECLTYRMGNHTTSDDASRYRSEEELKEWAKKDPIDCLKKLLQLRRIWSQDYEDSINKDAEEKVSAAISEMENTKPQALEDLFAYTYAEMAPRIKEQLAEARENDSNETK